MFSLLIADMMLSWIRCTAAVLLWMHVPFVNDRWDLFVCAVLLSTCLKLFEKSHGAYSRACGLFGLRHVEGKCACSLDLCGTVDPLQ